MSPFWGLPSSTSTSHPPSLLLGRLEPCLYECVRACVQWMPRIPVWVWGSFFTKWEWVRCSLVKQLQQSCWALVDIALCRPIRLNNLRGGDITSIYPSLNPYLKHMDMDFKKWKKWFFFLFMKSTYLNKTIWRPNYDKYCLKDISSFDSSLSLSEVLHHSQHFIKETQPPSSPLIWLQMTFFSF